MRSSLADPLLHRRKAPWACSACHPVATRPSACPSKLGRGSLNIVEIRGGLQPGDRVILSDTSAYDSSERVRLN